MAESIATYRKPEFPKLSVTENAFRTTIEYIGPEITLEAAKPEAGSVWGDFSGTVISTDYNLTENTSTAELTVVVELKSETGDESTFGALEATVYEIDWDVVARSMYEHPAFAIGEGGPNSLTTQDIIDIEAWRQQGPEQAEFKALYRYESNNAEGYVDLSNNARLFARGIELGQESYDDYAPIARKTSTYVGGPPGNSEAGEKDEPTGFSNKPTGYEWRKSADRTLSQGSRTRFDRTEEWLGAKKVLSDINSIYWAAP